MAASSDEAEAEATLIVDRAADAETLVVDRADSTVIVERGAAPDGTAGVTRTRGRSPAAPTVPSGRRRQGIAMPPVAPGFGRGAVDAVGPGAVAAYAPRAIPDAPSLPPPLTDPVTTRPAAASMPSVARRARRAGVIALAAFAASCLISVTGLVALAVALLR
jgi:hypothetical protein